MPASKAQRAFTAQRRAQCLALRLAGMPWDAIAERLEYASKAAACKDFERALAATRAQTAESASRHRDLELLRLERLNQAVWPNALRGDVKSVGTALDLHKARVRLLGLDAQQRTLDNAVDAWIAHLDGGDDLDPADQAALDAVA